MQSWGRQWQLVSLTLHFHSSVNCGIVHVHFLALDFVKDVNVGRWVLPWESCRVLGGD